MADFLKKHRWLILSGLMILFLVFLAIIYFKFSINPAVAILGYASVKPFYAVLISMMVVFLLAGFTVFGVLQKKPKIEVLAVGCVAFWGLIFMLILPFGTAPDEDTTYTSCYALSNVMMFQKDANEDDFVYMRGEDVHFLMHRYPGQDDYNTMLTHMFDRCEDSDMVLCSMQKMDIIFWAFLPQAVGITAARLLGMGQIGVLYAGRIMNFLLYLALFYLAIRRMPFGKNILFVISCFPMVLQQISSISYDAMVLGLSFYFIAIVLDLAFKKEKVTRSDLICMAVSMALLAPLKVIYCMMAFLCFLIPKEKFGTKKRYITAIGVMVAAVCVTILMSQANRFGQYIMGTNDTIVYQTNSEDKLLPFEDAIEQNAIGTEETQLYSFSVVFTHIPRMIAIFGNTLRLQLTYYLDQMIGGQLGWLEIHTPSMFLYAFVAMFLAVCVKEEEERFLPSTKTKLVFLGVFAIVSLLAYLFMLVGHTTLGAEFCMGVQGRYFLPVLPLIPFVCWNHSFVRKSTAREGAFEIGMAFAMSSILFWTVLSIMDIVVNRLGFNMVH